MAAALSLVARAALAYDADCCTRISMHQARLSLTANASANASATSLDTAQEEVMSCKRVPVPTAACSLVIPSQMSCCAPASAWRSAKHVDSLQLIKLPELKLPCRKKPSTRERALAALQQQVLRPIRSLHIGRLCQSRRLYLLPSLFSRRRRPSPRDNGRCA